MEGCCKMTIKNIIDEALDVNAVTMELQQLQALDKENANTATKLKNNPDLLKNFQSFQTLVQQQMKQRQTELLQIQQTQKQAVAANNANTTNNITQQATQANGSATPTQVGNTAVVGKTANQ